MVNLEKSKILNHFAPSQTTIWIHTPHHRYWATHLTLPALRTNRLCILIIPKYGCTAILNLTSESNRSETISVIVLDSDQSCVAIATVASMLPWTSEEGIWGLTEICAAWKKRHPSPLNKWTWARSSCHCPCQYPYPCHCHCPRRWRDRCMVLFGMCLSKRNQW